MHSSFISLYNFAKFSRHMINYIYLCSTRVKRCFNFAWLAVNSARRRASLVCNVPTVFSNFFILSAIESCVSLAFLNTSSSNKPSFLNNWQPRSVRVALA